MPYAGHAGWGAGALGRMSRERLASRAYGGGSWGACCSAAWFGARRRTATARTLCRGIRVTDLLRWGSAVFPEHRSFGALAKSGIGFVLTRRRLAASCAAAAIGVAALTYCAVGYVHFK